MLKLAVMKLQSNTKKSSGGSLNGKGKITCQRLPIQPEVLKSSQLPLVIREQIPHQARMLGLEEDEVEHIWRTSLVVDLRKYTPVKTGELLLNKTQIEKESISQPKDGGRYRIRSTLEMLYLGGGLFTI